MQIIRFDAPTGIDLVTYCATHDGAHEQALAADVVIVGDTVFKDQDGVAQRPATKKEFGAAKAA